MTVILSDYFETPLLRHITANGYHLEHRNGVPIVYDQEKTRIDHQDDQDAVQLLMDNYDELPAERAAKWDELKIEGLRRCNLVYDPNEEGDIVFEHVTTMTLIRDIDASYEVVGGGKVNRLQKLDAIFDEMENVRTGLGNQNDWELIRAYDVVNNPNWPV